MAKKKIDIVKQQLDLFLSNPILVMEQKGWNKAQYEETIAELEQKIENSKRGKSSKNKGASYERDIAKIFEAKMGTELRRTPMSGGFAKSAEKAGEFRGDIVSLDETIDFRLHIECKDQKTWSLPAWLRQSEDDCPQDKVPIVVFHRRQMNKDGNRIQEVGDFVTLSLEHFLDIVDKDKIIVPKGVKKPLKKLRRKVK